METTGLAQEKAGTISNEWLMVPDGGVDANVVHDAFIDDTVADDLVADRIELGVYCDGGIMGVEVLAPFVPSLNC